jgi:dTDP-4-amino-4,6-dideoxygalactose transaminase
MPKETPFFPYVPVGRFSDERKINPSPFLCCCPDCTPVARNIARQVMSLPMHADLTEAEQTRIATMLYHEVKLLSPA